MCNPNDFTNKQKRLIDEVIDERRLTTDNHILEHDLPLKLKEVFIEGVRTCEDIQKKLKESK